MMRRGEEEKKKKKRNETYSYVFVFIFINYWTIAFTFMKLKIALNYKVNTQSLTTTPAGNQTGCDWLIDYYFTLTRTIHISFSEIFVLFYLMRNILIHKYSNTKHNSKIQQIFALFSLSVIGKYKNGSSVYKLE